MWKDGDCVGRSRSYEIIEYRKKITEEICKSKELIKLLGCLDVDYPDKVIPWKYSYPHEYIPETQTKTDRFINFEINATIDPRNNVFKDLIIYFFVVCHEDEIRYKDNGREYLWYDKASCELDNLFCEKNVLGIGKTILVSNVPYSPQKKYKGRLLKFEVKDFNNGLKYGK